MNRMFVSMGSGFAFLAVALGAFGKHSLEKQLSPASLEIWQTAAHYHLIHAMALVLTGVLAGQFESKSLRIVGWLFAVGILIFSGCLYSYALTGAKIFGAITPLGGLCFLAAWLTLCVSMAKSDKQSVRPAR